MGEIEEYKPNPSFYLNLFDIGTHGTGEYLEEDSNPPYRAEPLPPEPETPEPDPDSSIRTIDTTENLDVILALSSSTPENGVGSYIFKASVREGISNRFFIDFYIDDGSDKTTNLLNSKRHYVALKNVKYSFIKNKDSKNPSSKKLKTLNIKNQNDELENINSPAIIQIFNSPNSYILLDGMREGSKFKLEFEYELPPKIKNKGNFMVRLKHNIRQHIIE